MQEDFKINGVRALVGRVAAAMSEHVGRNGEAQESGATPELDALQVENVEPSPDGADFLVTIKTGETVSVPLTLPMQEALRHAEPETLHRAFANALQQALRYWRNA